MGCSDSCAQQTMVLPTAEPAQLEHHTHTQAQDTLMGSSEPPRSWMAMGQGAGVAFTVSPRAVPRVPSSTFLIVAAEPLPWPRAALVISSVFS